MGFYKTIGEVLICIDDRTVLCHRGAFTHALMQGP